MPPQTTPRPKLTLDVEKYQSHLDDPLMTDTQRGEMLETLWSIVVGFIDLGFDVAPEETCGQPAQTAAEPAVSTPDMLDLDHRTTTTGARHD